MNTLQRSLPTAAFGATSPRKVDPSNGRKVMVATSRGEVIGVSFINLKVQVGGKGVTHDGQFRGPFVGVVDAGRKAKRNNGFLETPLLAARNLGVAHHADRMKYIFYVPQTWVKSGKVPFVPAASSSGSQSSGSTVYWDEKTNRSKSAKLTTRKRLSGVHALRRSKSAKQLTVVDKKLAVVEPTDAGGATEVPRSSSEVRPSRSLQTSTRRASEAPPRTLERDSPGASPVRKSSETSRRASKDALEILLSTSTTSTASYEDDEADILADTVPMPVKKPKRKSDVKVSETEVEPAKAPKRKSDVNTKKRRPKPSRSEESSPETYARSVPSVMRTGSLVPPLDLDAVAADSASTASSDDLSQDEDDEYDEYADRHATRRSSARVVADKKQTSKRNTEGSGKGTAKPEPSQYPHLSNPDVKPSSSPDTALASAPENTEDSSMKKRSSRRRLHSSTEKPRGKKEGSRRGSKSRRNSEPEASSQKYASPEMEEHGTYNSISRTEKGSQKAATKLDNGSYDSLSNSDKELYASLFKTVKADDISKPATKKKTERRNQLSQSQADEGPPPTDEVAKDIAALMAGSVPGGTPEMPAGLVAMGVTGARPVIRKKASAEKPSQSNSGAEAETLSPPSSPRPTSKTVSKRSSRTSSRMYSKSQKQSSRSSPSAPISSSSKTRTEKQSSTQTGTEKALAGTGAERTASSAGIDEDKSEAEVLDQEILKLSRFVETVRGGKFRSAKRRLSKAAAAQSARVQDENRREMEDMALEVIEEEDAASTTGRRSDKDAASTTGRRSDKGAISTTERRRSVKDAAATAGRRADKARDGTSAGPVKAAGTVGLVRPAATPSVHEVGKVHAWNADKKSLKSVLKPQSIVQPTSQTGMYDHEMRRVSSTDLFTTVVGLSTALSSRAAEAAARAMNSDGGYRRPST